MYLCWWWMLSRLPWSSWSSLRDIIMMLLVGEGSPLCTLKQKKLKLLPETFVNLITKGLFKNCLAFTEKQPSLLKSYLVFSRTANFFQKGPRISITAFAKQPSLFKNHTSVFKNGLAFSKTAFPFGKHPGLFKNDLTFSKIAHVFKKDLEFQKQPSLFKNSPFFQKRPRISKTA